MNPVFIVILNPSLHITSDVVVCCWGEVVKRRQRLALADGCLVPDLRIL